MDLLSPLKVNLPSKNDTLSESPALIIELVRMNSSLLQLWTLSVTANAIPPARVNSVAIPSSTVVMIPCNFSTKHATIPTAANISPQAPQNAAKSVCEGTFPWT